MENYYQQQFQSSEQVNHPPHLLSSTDQYSIYTTLHTILLQNSYNTTPTPAISLYSLFNIEENSGHALALNTSSFVITLPVFTGIPSLSSTNSPNNGVFPSNSLHPVSRSRESKLLLGTKKCLKAYIPSLSSISYPVWTGNLK
mmetsp:Transcript_25646/g.54175  ORF Transcript_25646/g.54175 Transcript_25646/m.54175 type:complete len:143 (-) Transcript_25646:682-1110(-)